MRRLTLAFFAAGVVCAAGPVHAQRAATPVAAPAAPAWTRGATCYEVFVRSFYDSDGNGIGDLKGLTAKLDYINDGNPGSTRSLGARCIWLMPIMPSPSYHGYDVSDYFDVNPQYGTKDDFRQFVTEAHRRGIRVLIDMVLNHSSDQHPYFQAALKDPSSPFRAFYRFSPTDPGTDETGQDHWRRSTLRDEYYYGFFSRVMPDLNYEQTPARDEAKRVAHFWLTDMGVDGFRLDAVEYLVEEGSRIRNTAGTHAFLREYADYVRRTKPDAFTVGEATWGSLDVLLTYYPDQLDDYFPFEASDSLIAAVRSGSARGLLGPFLRLQATVPLDRYSPFQRNHDQTRTLTALGGDVARARVAATLLLTLPGLPFVYYGEEIGMTGDKPDPNLRTPMQWSDTVNGGFTRGTPWEPLRPDWRTTNAAAQDTAASSLLNLYRRLIHLRAADSVLAVGRLVPLTVGHPAVASYLRQLGSRTILVVANLGAAPVAGLGVATAEGAVAPGRYRVRSLLGGPDAAPLRVPASGGIDAYIPFPTLAPLQAHVLELSPESR